MIDDTISRQAASEAVCKMLKNCFNATDEMIESVKITVGELPPAQLSVSKTEMVEDTISRQAALDALADYIHHVDKVIGTGHLSADDCMDVAKSVLGEDELPSAQPGWTPCTHETMPQESGEYLVTIKWDEGDYDVDIYEYDAYYKEWNDGDLYSGRVMAWQMKPEPWKGGRDA